MKRMLTSLATLIVVAWLVLCALLFLLQRQMLFLPQSTRVPASRTDFALDRDGVVLRGWRLNPGQPRALLYFGGNAEQIGWQRERYARWFPGHTVYLVAYRGYGASDGSPTEADLKADALALYDRVAGAHAAVDVLARSVGTGVALHLAARRSIARLALITPYDSLVEVAGYHYPWMPVRWLLRERFDALSDAGQVTAPALLLIARQDEIIPPVHAERLARAFPRPPAVQWLDSDHNTTEMDGRFALALQRHFRDAAWQHGGSDPPETPRSD
jgi:pimeloyl-ACP methyl ester carboxylesterase